MAVPSWNPSPVAWRLLLLLLAEGLSSHSLQCVYYLQVYATKSEWKLNCDYYVTWSYHMTLILQIRISILLLHLMFNFSLNTFCFLSNEKKIEESFSALYKYFITKAKYFTIDTNESKILHISLLFCLPILFGSFKIPSRCITQMKYHISLLRGSN